MNKLFVAGVSWNTTDEVFKAFFSAFGEVKDGMIMREQPSQRSRGFGFITYADRSSCDKVLAQELQLDGRKLDIKMAVSKEQMESTPAAASTKKLYVAGINFDTDEDGLFQFFSRFGDIESATIMKDKYSGKSRGFGFVTFVRDTSVEAAVHAQNEAALVLDGRNLDISAAYPRGSRELIKGYTGMSDVEKQQAKKVFVAGLLTTTTTETLRAYFEGFGKVADCMIQRDRATDQSRGFGFVTFEQTYVAKTVVGKDHTIEGKSVDCKHATPRPSDMMGGVQQAFMNPYGAMARGGPVRAYGGQAMRQQQQQPMGAAATYGNGAAMGQANQAAMGGMGAMAQQPNGMGMAGMGVGQYANGSQQQQSYGRNDYGYQQANGYGATVGFDVAEDYSTNGNPYGNTGSGYGAYGGSGRSGSARRAQTGFHPYSR